MSERVKNERERRLPSAQIARIREQAQSIQERVVSEDEADFYLDEALNELVSLTEEVFLLLKGSEMGEGIHKRDIENKLFDQLGLPPIESLLVRITEQYSRALSGDTIDGINQVRELETQAIPEVPSKFLINNFLFNNIRPMLVSWIGQHATDRLLKKGIVDTWLQLLFYRNPIAGKKESFFVLKKKDAICFSIDKGDETRQSFALHRERLNLMGPHVSVAYMPPGYEQPFHSQSRMHEHNLLVQGSQELYWIDEEGNTKVRHGASGDVLSVPPLVAHTIRNSGESVAINLMLKPFFERRTFLDESRKNSDNTTESPTILSTKRKRYEWGDSVSHVITSIDGFSYEAETVSLYSGKDLQSGPVRGRIPYEQEILISFARGALLVEQSSPPVVTLEAGDVLYAGADDCYRVVNIANEAATFVRLRLLKTRHITHAAGVDS